MCRSIDRHVVVPLCSAWHQHVLNPPTYPPYPPTYPRYLSIYLARLTRLSWLPPARTRPSSSTACLRSAARRPQTASWSRRSRTSSARRAHHACCDIEAVRTYAYTHGACVHAYPSAWTKVAHLLVTYCTGQAENRMHAQNAIMVWCLDAALP